VRIVYRHVSPPRLIRIIGCPSSMPRGLDQYLYGYIALYDADVRITGTCTLNDEEFKVRVPVPAVPIDAYNICRIAILITTIRRSSAGVSCFFQKTNSYKKKQWRPTSKKKGREGKKILFFPLYFFFLLGGLHSSFADGG
jgi:hypothetical protein